MVETACPECQGTGWILGESGSRTSAKRCKCYHERKNQILFEQAKIPRRYRDCTFKAFKPLNDSHRDALKISKKVVHDYPILDFGLLLLGPCGVGKTHLAAAIIHELIHKKNVPCYFCDFRELIRNIQNTFTPDSSLTESDLLEGSSP